MRYTSQGRTVRTEGDRSKRCEAFLVDLVSMCRKHGVCLRHEDHHGAFQVVMEPLDSDTREWLLDAHEIEVA